MTQTDFPENPSSRLNLNDRTLSLTALDSFEEEGKTRPISYESLPLSLSEDHGYLRVQSNFPRLSGVDRIADGQWRIDVTGQVKPWAMYFQGEIFWERNPKPQRGVIFWEHRRR